MISKTTEKTVIISPGRSIDVVSVYFYSLVLYIGHIAELTQQFLSGTHTNLKMQSVNRRWMTLVLYLSSYAGRSFAKTVSGETLNDAVRSNLHWRWTCWEVALPGTDHGFQLWQFSWGGATLLSTYWRMWTPISHFVEWNHHSEVAHPLQEYGSWKVPYLAIASVQRFTPNLQYLLSVVRVWNNDETYISFRLRC